MNFFTNKNDMKALLGKVGFWSRRPENKIINTAQYLGGLEGLEEAENNPHIINLEKRPHGFLVEVVINMKYHYVALTEFTWAIERQEEITVSKEKSVVGRALVGGLLLGPLGAIVGGMTGVGSKTEKINDVDNILSISHEGKILLLSIKDKELKSVYNFMRMHFKDFEGK